jgi:tetraacyldisaccharide 4'-kinase
MKKIYEELKRKKPWQAGITGILLMPLSLLYETIVTLWIFLYAFGIKKVSNAEGVKVISIGNITLGGTGKTPIAIKLARDLSEKGKKTAITNRGYLRESTEAVQVVSNGKEILARYPEAADEALLCAEKLSGIPVISSPKRIDGIKTAKEKFGVEVVILDDGFSHLAVARDLNLLVVDAQNPFGNGWIFPAGPLREPLGSLARADAVIVTRSNMLNDDELSRLREKLGKLSRGKPIFHADIVPGKIIPPGAGDPLAAGAFLDGKSVCLLSGIGSPEQFDKSVTELGGTVVKHFVFGDHHRFTETELDEAIKTAGDGAVVITTEKDFVRLPKQFKEKFYRLTIEVKIKEEEEFQTMVDSALV